MKYKGYELLKAIADGEIKKNQNIRIKFKDNSGEIFIFDGTEIIDITHKNIFDIYGTIAVLKSDFELIEDEIDIDSIEEFEIVGCNIKLNDTLLPTESIINDMILDKMNKLVQAVKQIDKRVKKLEGK